MFKPKIKDIVLKAGDSIKFAMSIIDRSGIGTAFVIDDKKRMIGSVTDGDVRQIILQGIDINSPVLQIMNPDPVFLFEDELDRTQRVVQKVNELLDRAGTNIYMPILNRKKILEGLRLCSSLIRFEKNAGSNRVGVKRVLVVGGAGYLGSVLSRRLLKLNYKVRVLDLLLFGAESLEELLPNPDFELVKGDMRNISTVIGALKGVDAVINLAAIVGDPACTKSPERTIETNYLANKLLAEACKYHQINRFIYASTCSVYGVGEGKLDENAKLNPVSLYARSKIQSEQAILSLMDENFSPCILRMSTLYGLSPRMRFDLVVNTMTKNAMVDKQISVFGGKQWRPLLHLCDAAEAYVHCLRAPIQKIKGQIYNVGFEEQNLQIITIGKMVKKAIPKTMLTVKKDSFDARDYFVCFDKIKDHYGYSAKKTVPDGIEEIALAISKGRFPDVSHPKYYNVQEG